MIAALTDVVRRFPRWGFWRLFDCLRTEGRTWIHEWCIACTARCG